MRKRKVIYQVNGWAILEGLDVRASYMKTGVEKLLESHARNLNA